MTEKTILIADDDHELVHVLAVRCRRLGLNVLCAHDAFTSLSLVKTGRPDVVCLDVDMPAGNGLSVCEMLSSDAACRTIPIIILTGRTDPETIMRATACAHTTWKNVRTSGAASNPCSRSCLVISTRRAPLYPSNPAERPLTILCIEDDPGIARIYERRLTAFGAASC